MNLDIKEPFIYKMIENMLSTSRVPQSLIFAGLDKTIKLEMAKHLISRIFEVDYNDYSTNTKRLIDDLNHPNINVLYRDKETVVSMESVNDMLKDAYKSPIYNGPKAYIINDADYLSVSAMNALLKFIEEPPLNTYIILISENLSDLLETIKSRCAIFNFRGDSKESLEEEFKDESNKYLLKSILDFTLDKELIKELIISKEIDRISMVVVDMFKERFEYNGSLTLYFNEHIDLLTKDSDIFKETKELFFLNLVIKYLSEMISKEYDLFTEEKERMNEIEKRIDRVDVIYFINELLKVKSSIENRCQINFKLNLLSILLDFELKCRGE